MSRNMLSTVSKYIETMLFNAKILFAYLKAGVRGWHEERTTAVLNPDTNR